MDKKNISDPITKIITLNKRIQYEYSILEKYEAGLSLKGWEVKSLRFGKIDIQDSYVTIKDSEVFLLGANFSPLSFSSIDCYHNQTRSRKLLLNQHELRSVHNYIKREGYTAVALSLYWKGAWCKVKIGIVKGKKQYDKRAALKERTWKLDKMRIIKNTRN